MKINQVVVLIIALVIGIVCVCLRLYESTFFSIYTDSAGRQWRVPNNNTFNSFAEMVIDWIPRLNYSLRNVDITFDMDNDQYMESNMLYIWICVGSGGIFMSICILFFIGRYCCNCCGGKAIPRGGYTEFQINSTRGFIIMLSFILEGVLLYGYFANSDLDLALGVLSETFKNSTPVLKSQFTELLSYLPDSSSGYYNKSVFIRDLNYSIRASSQQGEVASNLVESFEGYRMLLILLGLILATISCSVGIAAGSVRKGTAIVVMVVLSGFSGTLLFFSFGIHFTGSKLMREFCREMVPYLEADNDLFIPMKLQYFIPCINSPLYPYLSNHFFVNAVLETQNLTNMIIANGPASLQTRLPSLLNVTNSTYLTEISTISDTTIRNALINQLNKAIAVAKPAQIIDQSQTCRWSKNKLREQEFLMCSYTRDSLDMLMCSQGIGAVLLVCITFSAIPAIKMFEWAGNAGIVQNNQGFAGRAAKPKRKIKD